MVCPSCHKKTSEHAAFCGFCGRALKAGSNGRRSDWAETVIDHNLGAVPAAGLEARDIKLHPRTSTLDAKANPWQGPKKKTDSTAPKTTGDGWPRVDNLVHDTVPNHAISTVITPSDELAAAVAQTCAPEGPQSKTVQAATPVIQPSVNRGRTPAAPATTPEQLHAAVDPAPEATPGAPTRALVDSGAVTAPTHANRAPASAPSHEVAHAATALLATTQPSANTPAPVPVHALTGPALAAETDTNASGNAVDPVQQADNPVEEDAGKAALATAKKADKPKSAVEKARRLGVLPARRLIRLLMVVFGLGLVGVFAAPWLAAAQLPTDLGASFGQMGFAGLYPAAAAVVLIVAALLPLPYTLRALAAAALGLVGLSLTFNAPAIDWRAIVTTALLVLLPAALLHRARNRASVLSRIVVIVGVGGLLATLIIPSSGAIPLKQILAAAGTGGPFYKFGARAYPLVLLPLCAMCLITVVLGRKRSGLSRLWALLLLLFAPTAVWLGVAVSVYTVREALQGRLPALLQGLSTFFFLTLAAYGISQLFWKLSGAGKRPDALGSASEQTDAIDPSIIRSTGPLKPASSVGA